MFDSTDTLTASAGSRQIPSPRLRRVYDVLRKPSYFGLKRLQVWQMPAADALKRARLHIERMGA